MTLIFGFSIWFWGLLITEMLILTILVELESPMLSALSLLIFINLLWWFAEIKVWQWVKENPATLFKYFCYYIVLGIAWSFCKYYFTLKIIQKSIKKYKKQWNTINLPKNPSSTENNFTKTTNRRYETFKEFYILKDIQYNNNILFSKTNNRFMFWAMFWPTSCIWTLLNDPIKRFFNYLIYDLFIGVYQKMHKTMIEDLLKDNDSKKDKK